MAFEVDFMAVGDGEKSGDAIALRFGDLVNAGDRQTVVVIDGGNKESGAALVEHIRTFYRTSRVDLVINTHPDADHASGLAVVLGELTVSALWMHQPWNHAQAKLFKDGRITADSLDGRLREELVAAHALEELARSKNIPVAEPFTGRSFSAGMNGLTVLGPTPEYYNELLLRFRCTPEPKKTASMGDRLMNALASGVEYAKSFLEDWGIETLADPAEGATSAENNSSAIILLQSDYQYCLFTGDAGVPALSAAIDRAVLLGVDLTTCRLHQVPHHGSRHNVGPTLLDRLLGPKPVQPTEPTRSAIVSASKLSPKHPSKRVTNAYYRRGRNVVSTQGQAICHAYQTSRPGWSAATPIPFHAEVEENDE